MIRDEEQYLKRWFQIVHTCIYYFTFTYNITYLDSDTIILIFCTISYQEVQMDPNK